jgi:hypothetical protein
MVTTDETESAGEAGAEKETGITGGTMAMDLEGPAPSMMITDLRHPRIRNHSAECIPKEAGEEGLVVLSPAMQTF